MNSSTAKCNTLSCDEPWQVVDISRCYAAAIVSDGRRRRSVYDKKPVNVTPKTTEQHLIVTSGKSKAEVIIIKDCAVEANC